VRKIETYTVRNEQGQLIGRYRATSSESAIRAAKDEQLVMCSTFRKSHRMPRGMDELTAKVED